MKNNKRGKERLLKLRKFVAEGSEECKFKKYQVKKK